MIEQLHYATTPKYNFPKPLEDLRLPQRLIELSINSMESIKGKPFQSYGTDFAGQLVDEPQHDPHEFSFNNKTFTAQLTPLKPIRDDTPIIAIDVSSMKIGETDSGILCTVRGSIVWCRARRYRYLRFGPFPFHITEENKREILRLLNRHNFTVYRYGSFRLIDIQTKLCNLIEKWIQMKVSHSSHSSIVLWDGSLTAGTIDSPVNVVSRILEEARKNFNSVLAFSKMTNLRLFGQRITDLVWKYPPPCLFSVSSLPISASNSIHSLGDIYVAKLTKSYFSFRLDIDRRLSSKEKVEAVQKVLGNDLIFQSYPESLRLAHIYSTFTANEVIGIQRYITQRYGLQMITRPRIRKMLFGPYGTGLDD